MEAMSNRRSMDPLQKKILLWGTLAGAIMVTGSFVLGAATHIVRLKEAVEAVPVLQAKDDEFERRLAEQERSSKMILLWLQAFGEKWDVKPPRPWADRRRPNE